MGLSVNPWFYNVGANPFARKKPRDAAPSASPNPFARNGIQKSLSTVKSTSFFEKVDAAEGKLGLISLRDVPNLMINVSHIENPIKGKKGKRDSRPRQTTLFGLPPPPANDKPSKKGKEKAVAAKVSETRETSHSVEPEEATQLDEEPEEETQSGDGEEPEEETEEIEETQRDSPEWEVPDEEPGEEESLET